MNRKVKHFYEFDHFRLDAQESLLIRDGEVVTLPPKALDLLLILVENSGHVLSKERLMREVWPNTIVEEANLSHQVFILRKALGEEKNGVKFIKTIPRRGYRFVAPVVEVQDEPADILITEQTRSRIIIEEEFHPPATFIEAAGVPPLSSLKGKVEEGQVKRRARLTLPLGIGLAILIGGGLWFWLWRAESKPPLPPMTIVPLTTYPDDEFDPALSPDGKFIAFAWTGGNGIGINLYVKQVDAGSPIQLTFNKDCRNGSIAWSPDGRFIAFVRFIKDEAKCGVFTIPALGGTERKLYPSSVVQGLSWSPDGKQIAFLDRSSPSAAYSVFLLSVETLETRRLTSPPASVYGDLAPAFSPDGNYLAYCRQSGDSTTSEVYLVAITGGEPRQLTFDNRRVVGFDWTADGKELILSSNRTGSFNLWRLSASGGEPHRLSMGIENALDPSISRQGNRLAYTQLLHDRNIYKVELSNSKLPTAVLLKGIASSRVDANSKLSQDGKRIVFESNRTGSYEIWAADSDGSNPVQLTSFGNSIALNPCWSPDGQQVAFVCRQQGKADLYTINLESTSPHRLTAGIFDCVAPNWSKDGKWIYFGSDQDGTWQVWKIPAEGGYPVRVTTEGGYESMGSPDGRFLYYNKYGFNTVGIFRIPVEGGPEAMVYNLPQLESFGDWFVTNEGLYFIHRYDVIGKITSRPAIKFLNFTTGEVSELVALDKDPGSNPGLNISPDGRWLIYAKEDFCNHDIILLDNFR
jgi:Tol biopolymer transport system component/DNA-binding winged helix-turn-helix (wHTH) protein